MDWFNANKTTIGGVLTAIGGVLALNTSNYPHLVIWSQIFLAVGPFLAGGGTMRPDSYYKPYVGDERRTEHWKDEPK